MTNEDQANPEYVLDVVKRKLLDSLDAFERGNNLRNRILEYNERHPKRPLSLSAIADGPRLRLLWATFQQIEKEARPFCLFSLLAIIIFFWIFFGI